MHDFLVKCGWEDESFLCGIIFYPSENLTFSSYWQDKEKMLYGRIDFIPRQNACMYV